MIQGQDYSHYNAKVNFPLAIKNGQKVFYLKSSEGNNWSDDTYEEKRLACIPTKAPFAPYHFMKMAYTAVSQAAWFKKCAPDPTPLPPIADIEQHPAEPDNLLIPMAKKRSHVQTLLLETERLFGRRPIIYTGVYWWKDNIGDVSWAKDYKFIIAGYLFFKQAIPANFNIWWPGPRTLFYIPRENVIGWQWAGDIPNISNTTYPWSTGAQDFNVFDEVQIAALVSGSTETPPLTEAEKLDLVYKWYLESHGG